MTTLLLVVAAAAIVASLASVVTAEPVPPPDLTRCQPALEPDNKTGVLCCIPAGANIIVDFTPPPPTPHSAVRVRPAAHLVDASYIAKYTRAVEAMKSLGPDHPWSYPQQANVHCAYCTGAYGMPGYSNISIQVHESWLFFPFHRLYLYFHERILGKLIGDDTFALPFWNWDSPDGMAMPAMYANSSSALYDPLRDPAHQPPTTIDLNYNLTDVDAKPTSLIGGNLRTTHRQMVRASTAELFLGSRYVAGMQPSPGGGSFELDLHNTVHSWTGDRRQPNVENMGAFYSAARDPIFFAHHGNVDRMWQLWSTLPGRNRRGFDEDDEWLDASFVFWDENLQLVRARVRDCLDAVKLGYTYQDVPIPWTDYKPVRPAEADEKPVPTEGLKLPVCLKSAVSVEVKRPKVARSREEKEHEEEVLVVDDIVLVKAETVKFDVYVNARADDESKGPESANFAGSFVHLPMGSGMTTRLSLGISELLSEINADGDESIVVSLIPRRGNEVTVGDVRIEFSS